ncbi:spore germination protein [Peribacillus sp. R9-11]|uniref:spore germination protein n=1 Tax=Peribacillus sp. R9-11 TaxID=3073271 RepID=UPI00286888B2|nr:spore germination protein [Peribacillus sp. R9-11]WMX53695.1 spore germination protein [Peribacillus sp. R9-11]
MKLFKNKQIEQSFYNEEFFRQLFSNSPDVSFKVILGENDETAKITLFFYPGMVDTLELNGNVLRNLKSMLDKKDNIRNMITAFHPSLALTEISCSPVDNDDVNRRIFSGEVLIFFQQSQQLFSLPLPDVPNRKPEESSFEVSLRGPRDGFVEDLSTNVALIRKRLRTGSLSYEEFIIGNRSQTTVALMYIDDIINPELVRLVRERLNTLDVDVLISSHQLEELISKGKFKLFPLTHYTSRPDFCVGSLTQGRFIVLMNGAPTVIIAPTTLLLQIKAAEDSSLPFLFVSFERFLRVFGLIFSILLPGFWVALSAYNIDQMPFPLLATVSISRLGLPVSVAIEMFLMLGLFELFRESGVRLPQAVGQTVAVVGGLIVGDAAIRAGLTSPTMLVIASVTSVASYTLVNQSLTGTVSVLRLFILILGSVLGIYGLLVGFLIVTCCVSCLESFGVPYMNEFSPPNFQKLTDAIFKRPWYSKKKNEGALDRTQKGE